MKTFYVCKGFWQKGKRQKPGAAIKLDAAKDDKDLVAKLLHGRHISEDQEDAKRAAARQKSIEEQTKGAAA